MNMCFVKIARTETGYRMSTIHPDDLQKFTSRQPDIVLMTPDGEVHVFAEFVVKDAAEARVWLEFVEEYLVKAGILSEL